LTYRSKTLLHLFRTGDIGGDGPNRSGLAFHLSGQLIQIVPGPGVHPDRTPLPGEFPDQGSAQAWSHSCDHDRVGHGTSIVKMEISELSHARGAKDMMKIHADALLIDMGNFFCCLRRLNGVFFTSFTL
jgi:hypothetical protein